MIQEIDRSPTYLDESESDIEKAGYTITASILITIKL